MSWENGGRLIDTEIEYDGQYSEPGGTPLGLSYDEAQVY